MASTDILSGQPVGTAIRCPRNRGNSKEVGVAVSVLFEGSWGGVELAAVEFDDESLGVVDGVDLVAGYLLVELWCWQVVALEEADANRPLEPPPPVHDEDGVEFPRFRGHLTAGPSGLAERMSVDAKDTAVFEGVSG